MFQFGGVLVHQSAHVATGLKRCPEYGGNMFSRKQSVKIAKSILYLLSLFLR